MSGTIPGDPSRRVAACGRIARAILAPLARAAPAVAAAALACTPAGAAEIVASSIATGERHTCAITTAGGVRCWGGNGFGQLGDGGTDDRRMPVDVPGLANGVVAVATGQYHTCALTSAGGVKCWGDNFYGQLGDGTFTGRLAPVDVPGLLSGVAAIAAGQYHTCALTAAGEVGCWGRNGDGQLGDGSTINRAAPVGVAGWAGGAIAIAAGGLHTCAIAAGGGVKCWGFNLLGQLGDGTTTSRTVPVDVSGLAGAATIAAGFGHTCALTTGGGAKCWGDNFLGQLGDGTTASRSVPGDVPGLASGVSAIATGFDHTCALAAGGAVQCWGDNAFGQLGDGSGSSRLSPGAVPAFPGGVGAIAAGRYHGCAITTEGGAKCWGYNFFGQLGDGTLDDRAVPVDVAGFPGGVAAIAAGNAHTCFLSTGGGVKCAGYNFFGQVGDGTSTDRPVPVEVPGLAGGATAIAAGLLHTCALATNGGVKCWGSNDEGGLGDGTTTRRYSPVDVVGAGGAGLLSGVAALAAGSSHTCALTTGGGVKCWGSNGNGQLGNFGVGTRQTAPVDVIGLASGVAAIASGATHSCALTTGGAVKCWGNNGNGQLGDNQASGTASSAPVDVTGLSSGAAAIAAGGNHTCALTTGGAVKCWGENAFGQLGDGGTGDLHAPATVPGLAGVAAVAAGQGHTCALTAAGGVTCWGYDVFGQLGDGTSTLQRLAPVHVIGAASGVAAVAAGGFHACALTTGGIAKCWGANSTGQLGDGNANTQSLVPVAVTGVAGGVAAIAAGESHACALTTDGAAKCWGNNGDGRLGDGTTANRSAPVAVSGLAGGMAAIASGTGHACALTATGGVKCWGRNASGQLGDGTTSPRLAPVDVTGLANGVAAIATGDAHTCALTTGGAVKCWGFNGSGQLGDGTTGDRATPADVPGLASGVATIAAAGNHTCAVTTAGAAKCWGANGSGQLGNGTTANASAPVDVTGLASGAAAIAAGAFHTCVLATSGAVSCWGFNGSGQLGDGTTTPRLSPVPVVGLASGAAAISAGGAHTCALTTGRAVRCWGDNSFGRLGDGTTTNASAPVDVPALANGVAAIAAGGAHTCALTAGRTVQCWGSNGFGQLGDGSTASRPFPASGRLVVQSIAFAPPATATIGVPVNLPASATSDLAVSLETWTPSTCMVSGGTVTPVAGRLCGVRARQAGNAEFRPAPLQQRIIFVPRFAQAVAFTSTPPAAAVAGGPAYAVTATGGASGNPVVFGIAAASTAGACTIAGAVVSFTGPGTCTVAADQAGNATYDAAPRMTQSIVVALDPATDFDGDGIPNGVESAEGRDPLAKDNDVFAVSRLFAMQQYRDFLGREGDPGGLSLYTGLLDADPQLRGPIIEAFFNSPEFSASVSPIVRLYFATFRRIPDYDGLLFQVDAYRDGTPLTAIADNFTLSPEFQAAYGALSDPQFVALLYANVLGRTGTPPEIDFHVSRLAAGATRGEVLAGFSESPEFQANTANDVYVTMMYVGMLRRAPEQAGFDYWVAYMDAGNPGLNLILGFLNAPEYRARFLP